MDDFMSLDEKKCFAAIGPWPAEEKPSLELIDSYQHGVALNDSGCTPGEYRDLMVRFTGTFGHETRVPGGGDKIVDTQKNASGD